MILYLRYKFFLKDKTIFDRWVEMGGKNYLVKWDHVNKFIIVKDDKFKVIQDIHLTYAGFKPNGSIKIILERLLENELKR